MYSKGKRYGTSGAASGAPVTHNHIQLFGSAAVTGIAGPYGLITLTTTAMGVDLLFAPLGTA